MTIHPSKRNPASELSDRDIQRHWQQAVRELAKLGRVELERQLEIELYYKRREVERSMATYRLLLAVNLFPGCQTLDKLHAKVAAKKLAAMKDVGVCELPSLIAQLRFLREWREEHFDASVWDLPVEGKAFEKAFPDSNSPSDYHHVRSIVMEEVAGELAKSKRGRDKHEAVRELIDELRHGLERSSDELLDELRQRRPSPDNRAGYLEYAAMELHPSFRRYGSDPWGWSCEDDAPELDELPEWFRHNHPEEVRAFEAQFASPWEKPKKEAKPSHRSSRPSYESRRRALSEGGGRSLLGDADD